MDIVVNYLSNAAPKTHAFKDLVKRKRSNQRPNGALILRHPQSDPNNHRVENNPNLQHLRHKPLLQPHQHFLTTPTAIALRTPRHRLHIHRQFTTITNTILSPQFLPRPNRNDLVLPVVAATGLRFHVGGRREVDEERQQGADHGHEPREGVVFPGVVGGHAAVGERDEGVGEHVDQGGGEDDPCREALDQKRGFFVCGLSLEVAGQEDWRRNSDDARDEDDDDRN